MNFPLGKVNNKAVELKNFLQKDYQDRFRIYRIGKMFGDSELNLFNSTLDGNLDKTWNTWLSWKRIQLNSISDFSAVCSLFGESMMKILDEVGVHGHNN